jgi:hypothetical protein
MDNEKITHAGIFGTNPDHDDVVDALDKLDQADRTFEVATHAIEALDETGNLASCVAVLLDAKAMVDDARRTLVDALMRDRAKDAINAQARAVAQ